ncbi:arsenical resistance protein ArsH [Photorhabdus laumondii]
MIDTIPNVIHKFLDVPSIKKMEVQNFSSHKPRILLLYGSNRKLSFSRLLVQESALLLEQIGAEIKIFNPSSLPLPDTTSGTHEKVIELHELMQWSEGQVWCSPEHHGSMSAVFKSQLDWVPELHSTQGKTLALLQVNGGAQSFNVVNQLRTVGRCMRMFIISNQLSVPKAFLEFDDSGRMKPSSYYNRLVDVMEELIKFTILLRDRQNYLLNRYSERN